MDDLTPLQRRFCLEYLKDQNGTRAAIRAGYAKRGAGAEASRLLRNVNIRRYIRSAIAEQESRLKVSADRVIKEFARIAFFDPVVLEAIASGDLSLKDLTPDERAAIQSYQLDAKEYDDKDAGKVTESKIRVKAHSKNQALEALAKHFRLFEEAPDDEPEEYERPESMRE